MRRLSLSPDRVFLAPEGQIVAGAGTVGSLARPSSQTLPMRRLDEEARSWRTGASSSSGGGRI